MTRRCMLRRGRWLCRIAVSASSSGRTPKEPELVPAPRARLSRPGALRPAAETVRERRQTTPPQCRLPLGARPASSWSSEAANGAVVVPLMTPTGRRASACSPSSCRAGPSSASPRERDGRAWPPSSRTCFSAPRLPHAVGASMNAPARRRVARLRAGLAGRRTHRPGRRTPSRTPGAAAGPAPGVFLTAGRTWQRQGRLEPARDHANLAGVGIPAARPSREIVDVPFHALGKAPPPRAAPGQPSAARPRVEVLCRRASRGWRRPRFRFRFSPRRATASSFVFEGAAPTSGARSFTDGIGLTRKDIRTHPSRRLGRPLGGRHAGHRRRRLQRGDVALTRPGIPTPQSLPCIVERLTRTNRR